MSSKTDPKPKNIKIFALDEFEKLLKGVKVATCMLTETQSVVVDEESVIKRLNTLTLSGLSGGEQCSCCGAGPFESRAQQTAHYKHHWHTYNLKRRLFGRQPLSLADFNVRQDDNSSVSGSDSEGESNPQTPATDLFAAVTRHCKAFFTNTTGQVFCIYRCVLHHRKEELSTDGSGQQWEQRCRNLAAPGSQRWAVLMLSGGHFAGAIFSGGEPVLHKTLHSYVVRRGQGQAQAARDQHGSAPRSAGASLRRYNQAQFVQHIQDILSAWAADLGGCSLVLYRAVGPLNQAALFGKGGPLSRDDPRVRALPFPTRKPTYKEVQRAHATVANVEVYESMELFQAALVSGGKAAAPDAERARRPQRSPAKPIDRAKSREPVCRALPTLQASSEDEGPSFIDSDFPAGWVRALSEQASRGLITNSRKDLMNDIPQASQSSDEEAPQQKQTSKKKKKKKEDKLEMEKVVQKPKVKIPENVKKLWQLIADTQQQSLLSLLQQWRGAAAGACNLADPVDGNTALHKAAIAAKNNMVTEILTSGGDPCLRNHLQQTPYAAAPHADTRVTFRLFQAEYPDRYNYAKAHIPGPLTPALLAAELERKAAQRKAKRQRDRERQQERAQAAGFVQLSDAEKVKDGGRRCFLCGASLPKTPFDYQEYTFCSIKCLQNHRNVRPLHMTA